jgi:acyl-CoA synthetase (AMP-forming)/AMP-acid ligase II
MTFLESIPGERTAFLGDGICLSYAELREQVAAVAVQAHASKTAIFEHLMAWEAEPLIRFLGYLKAGSCLSLAGPVSKEKLEPFAGRGGLLILPTAGTTGVPKRAVHSVPRFLSAFEPQDRPEIRQLVGYGAGHVAGIDAFLQLLCRGATLVLPSSGVPEAIASAIERYRVQVLPATPSWLQFLLLSGALESVNTSSVEVIPHGAEPMPTGLLKRLASVFPAAEFRNRFGTTETGALDVEPSREGLRLKAGKSDWKVVEGELWIRTGRRMLGTLEEGPLDNPDDWYATGDLAEELPGGEIRLMGRRSSLINVGGRKVQPELVEAFLLEDPLIVDARVLAEPHPLTGQSVVAEVVLAEAVETRALIRWMRERGRAAGLPLTDLPVKVTPVTAIERSAAFKRKR